MFLSNIFNEKLKKYYLEGEYDQESLIDVHQYIPNKKDPRVLFYFKDTFKTDPLLSSSSNLTSQQLKALDKTEWENTFTLKNLYQKWKTRAELDFEPNFKKFTDEAAFPKSKPAKEYIRNLRDPDILELKQKYWNISNNTKEKFRPELKKTLFEVSKGLKDFKIVPLKEKKVNEGVDTRDHIEIDGNSWNISNLINKRKFKLEENENLNLAKENSFNYWKTNEKNREDENPFPIDEERKKIEIIRYFKKYRSPYQKTIDYYNTMDKVKELTFIEKENVEKKVQKENPGLLPRYPEKINALVFKGLSDTYKDKYKELTGKLSKEELKKRQIEQNKFKWTDADLANKITAINKLDKSGILRLDLDKNNTAIRISQSQKKDERNILLPLVVKGTEIEREEEKIKEKLQEEFKRQKRLEMLLEAKTFKKKKKVDKFISKYPISKKEYDFNKNYKKTLSMMDFSNQKEDKLQKRISYIANTSTNIDNETTNSILNEISKNSDCDPHFLKAYTIVAGREFERIHNFEKKKKTKIRYEYSHPGTYRAFVFIEKNKKNRPIRNNDDISNLENENGENAEEYEEKVVKNKFWSCCMNSDPNSPGCQKKIIKNFKYLYD